MKIVQIPKIKEKVNRVDITNGTNLTLTLVETTAIGHAL